MKVAIYCRVSTLEQKEKGYSIDEQQRKLKSFCEINDWTIYNTYIDPGFSGGNLDRPAFKELMNDMDKFDLVLVYKLDRMTRNVRDLLDTLDKFEKNDVAFRSATEVYDTTNAMGRLFVTLVGAMAEWERTTITERTTMGRRAAAKKGIPVSRVPFFYDKRDGKLYPNKYKEVIDFAVNEVIKGTSVREITNQLNHSQYKPPSGKLWYKNMILSALKSPIARGHSVYEDILVENTHDPVISDEDYNIIQQRISERTNSKTIKHPAIFKTKIVCPNCNSRLTMGTSKHKLKNGTEWYAKYYFCDKCKFDKNVTGINIKEDEVEKVFVDYLSKLDLESYKVNIEEKKNGSIIDIDKIMNQRKKYHELYAMDMMQEEELFTFIKETDVLIAQYEKQKDDKLDVTIELDKVKNIKNIIADTWENLNVLEKQEFINLSVKNIYVTYVRGKRGRTPNSINIDDITFY